VALLLQVQRGLCAPMAVCSSLAERVANKGNRVLVDRGTGRVVLQTSIRQLSIPPAVVCAGKVEEKEEIVKLPHAYHCQSCQEIFERAPRGVCPVCTSHEVYSLSWLVKSAAERESWLRRIYGAKPRQRFLTAASPRPALTYSCSAEANTLEPEVA
jgi:hypothetical protein